MVTDIKNHAKFIFEEFEEWSDVVEKRYSGKRRWSFKCANCEEKTTLEIGNSYIYFSTNIEGFRFCGWQCYEQIKNIFDNDSEKAQQWLIKKYEE